MDKYAKFQKMDLVFKGNAFETHKNISYQHKKNKIKKIVFYLKKYFKIHF